jgi:hypothetical protein
VSVSLGINDDKNTMPGCGISARLTLNSNKPSGTRIRRAADNATMSNYVKHTSQETSRSYAYTKSAKKSTLYYMRGKKDDCSTSSSQLNVIGRVTY